jgi:SagB-type dehydrogenase family enzyme
MKKIFSLSVFLVLGSISSTVAQELVPIQLPAPQVDTGKSLMQALKMRQSSRSFHSRLIPLQDLSNLLWAADGINRPESGKRTAPSAMNWQETDIYVVLPEGAYIYEAKTHRLDPVVAGDLRGSTGKQEFVKDAPLNLVYVVDNVKMSKANDEDKLLYSALDVGFIAQNVYLFCASQGFAVVVRGSVDRPPLEKLLKLRPSQRIILAQTVGYPK